MNKENDKRIYQMSSDDMNLAMVDAVRNNRLNVEKERGVVVSETDYIWGLLYAGQIMREFEKEIERFRIDKEEGE